MRKLAFLSLFVFLSLFTAFIFSVSAQVSGVPSLVNNVEIVDSEAKPGDILANPGDGIRRSSKAYDSQMIGVIVSTPVISVGDKTTTSVALLSSGRALVNVSAVNGVIKSGDFITSSDAPGVAQKATSAGYVLGKALESYEDTSKNGEIAVLVEIGYFSQNPNVTGFLGSLLGALSIGFANSQNFPLILRYIAAALVGIITFAFVSFSFVRFMRNGIEAIGRNPLAKATIIWGMAINGVIVGVLAIAGFGIALAIILF